LDKILLRITAVLLLGGAVFGLALSVGGLLTLWRFEAQLSAGLNDAVEKSGLALEAAAGMLAAVDQSLGQVEEQIALIEKITLDAAGALAATGEVSQSVAGLVGEDLKEVVNQTQTALAATQSSARLVDDTLGFISSIPLIGARYKPDQPLHTSLEQVNRSLDGVPASLGQVQADMDAAAQNLAALEANIAAMSASIGEIKDSLQEARRLTTDYRAVVGELQSSQAATAEKMPGWQRAFHWGASAFLVWLAISQLGLFVQGIQLLKSRGPAENATG
jgi:chromosome segregation ATPase